MAYIPGNFLDEYQKLSASIPAPILGDEMRLRKLSKLNWFNLIAIY